MKFKGFIIFLASFLMVVFVDVSWAESQLVIYPAKGQSEKKMNEDKSACHTWAVKESGFDPSTAATSSPKTPPPKGGRLRGGARGAAGGAAIGAIAGDAGKGAAIGATAGGMRGGAQQRRGKREQEAAQEKAEAQQQQGMSSYNKAYSACLEGRGYTVK